MLDNIENTFMDFYSNKLKHMLNEDSISINLYCNRYNKVYKMPASVKFRIEDLLHIIKIFFKLSESETIYSENIKVSLSHSIVFNGKKQVFLKTLEEVGIGKNPIVTYWTTINWKDGIGELNSNV